MKIISFKLKKNAKKSYFNQLNPRYFRSLSKYCGFRFHNFLKLNS